MHIFNSEYLYIFTSSFKDNFSMALLSSIGVLFFFTIFILSLLAISFLIISIIKLPDNQFRYRSSQGRGLCAIMLFPVMIFSLIMTFFSFPEMSFITFQVNHVKTIYPIYYKNQIAKYKNQPTLIKTNLKNNSASQVLYKKFLQCFDNKNFTIPNQTMTISDMENHIRLQEEYCLHYANNFVINNALKHN